MKKHVVCIGLAIPLYCIHPECLEVYATHPKDLLQAKYSHLQQHLQQIPFDDLRLMENYCGGHCGLKVLHSYPILGLLADFVSQVCANALIDEKTLGRKTLPD